MYYPIQIPYRLNRAFADSVQYSEEIVPDLADFVICFWAMQPRADCLSAIDNIIVADGCIDLVAGYDERRIGFAGMSKTDFHFEVALPGRYMGARLKPGAFCQLTGRSARAAMDAFLPMEDVCPDFDRAAFFALPFEQARHYFQDFCGRLIAGQQPDGFTSLFDRLSERAPTTTAQLYQLLHFSARQCQRLFEKHYGFSPKMALSILRFQRCLEIMTSDKANANEIMEATGYYDQSHFIKDFTKHIGITPRELIRTYQS